jgi:hypothetical protein
VRYIKFQIDCEIPFFNRIAISVFINHSTFVPLSSQVPAVQTVALWVSQDVRHLAYISNILLSTNYVFAITTSSIRQTTTTVYWNSVALTFRQPLFCTILSIKVNITSVVRIRRVTRVRIINHLFVKHDLSCTNTNCTILFKLIGQPTLTIKTISSKVFESWS